MEYVLWDIQEMKSLKCVFEIKYSNLNSFDQFKYEDYIFQRLLNMFDKKGK